MSETNGISTAPTRSRIRHDLWQTAYPTMISFTLLGFYDIIDMAWVGQYSKPGITAVTIFTTLFGIFSILNSVAGASSISLIAQSHGRGDSVRTMRISEQTISFKVVLAIITSLLMVITTPILLPLYTDDTVVMKMVYEYGNLRLWTCPFFFMTYSINTIFRCTGDAKTPMKLIIIATIINIVLDPILIFETIPILGIKGAGLGVFGASLATAIATIVHFVYGMYLLFAPNTPQCITWRGMFSFDKDINWSLLKIGMPSGVELFLRNFFLAVMMIFVAKYGVTAIAVAGIGGRVVSFAALPSQGFMMAGSTIVGNFLGKDDVRSAEKTTEEATKLIMIALSGFLAFMLLWPQGVLNIFTQDKAIIYEGVFMLRCFAVMLALLGAMIGKAIAFSGSGHNKPLMISGLVSRWGVQLPLLFVMTTILNWPLYTIWLSFIFCEAIEIIIIYIHYQRDEWRHKRV